MLRTSQEGEEENTHKQTKGPRYIYLSSWPFCHDHDVYMFFVFCPLMSERGYEALFCLSKVFTLQSILSFYVTTVGESKCAKFCIYAMEQLFIILVSSRCSKDRNSIKVFVKLDSDFTLCLFVPG